jgi:hypothetical protein
MPNLYPKNEGGGRFPHAGEAGADLAKRAPIVTLCLQDLNLSVGRLQALTEELSERLTPLLAPHPSPAPEPGGNMPALAPLAGAIRENDETVKAIIGRMEVLLKHLEI